MKNWYADLEKISTYYGCTFDDVIVENIVHNKQAFIS
jgi:2-iminobutanoate/2-iminopropanoate deaminase